MRDQGAALVSVGIPTWNRAELLARSVESVLNQTFTDLECIIVDNCSTDRTEEVCRGFAAHDGRVRYVRQPNFVSVFENYNECFRRSRGQYFCWLSDDDLYEPEFVARCVQVLEEDQDVVLAAPWFRYHTDEDAFLALDNWPDLTRMPMRQRARYILTEVDKGAAIYGLIRSDVLRVTGLFRQLREVELLLLLELSLHGGFRVVPEVLYHKFYKRGRNLSGQRRPSPENGFYWPTSRFGENGDVLLRTVIYLRAVKQHRRLPVRDRLSVAAMIVQRYLISSGWVRRVLRDTLLFLPRRLRNLVRRSLPELS